ncbi:hypothetical protein VTK56DRAFT_5731 [Thermocarpiscus australiensis]
MRSGVFGLAGVRSTHQYLTALRQLLTPSPQYDRTSSSTLEQCCQHGTAGHPHSLTAAWPCSQSSHLSSAALFPQIANDPLVLTCLSQAKVPDQSVSEPP